MVLSYQQQLISSELLYFPQTFCLLDEQEFAQKKKTVGKHLEEGMAKTCMACKIQQRDCPSCQAQSNTSGSGALRAHEYREAKKSRFDQTEADLVRTRVAHGMLMTELDASKYVDD